MRALAKRHNIPFPTLRDQAIRNKWHAIRNSQQAPIRNKAIRNNDQTERMAIARAVLKNWKTIPAKFDKSDKSASSEVKPIGADAPRYEPAEDREFGLGWSD